MPVRRIASMWRDRGEELVCPFLFLVWRRVGCYLWLSIDKVARKTPHFFLAIETVKDEISVFVFAVGIGTNVILETQSFGKPIYKTIIILTRGRLHRRIPENRWVTERPPNMCVVMSIPTFSSTLIR
jgi:hypothetical protein